MLKQGIQRPMRLMLGGDVRHVLLLHIPDAGMMHLLGQRKGMLLRGCCMLCCEQSLVPLSGGISQGGWMADDVQLLLRPVSIMAGPAVNDFVLLYLSISIKAAELAREFLMRFVCPL